ncbi:MAG: glutathione S-transferase N-terminal domain-containing protein, partial [Solirubrobacterales bacterium]
MGEAKLYVIPGSHPSMTARLMLERKGIPYKRVDLIPVLSKAILRAKRFPGATVPAIKLEGRRIQGSREIARELDRIQPEPALVPADPDKRVKVEEAEAWGDEFQQKPRRLSWWALRRDRAPMASYSEGARLGVPVGLAVKTGGPIVATAARLNGSTDANVRADLATLRSDLDRLDAWIADGVIAG